MRKLLVLDFDKDTISLLSDESIIVRIEDFQSLTQIRDFVCQHNSLFAIWMNFSYSSLSQIQFDETWKEIPIILNVYNIGDANVIFNIITLLRCFNIRIFFPASNEENVLSCKLLSSLGVNCALTFPRNEIVSDESLLDLASWFYMSPVPHASIEPFDYIWRNLNQERNIDFSTVYLENPYKYLHIDKSLNVALTREHLLNKEYVGTLQDLNYEELEMNYKKSNYYQHFLDLDNCSKCEAFKICNRRMLTKLQNCEKVFAEIYEYAELRDQMEQNNSHQEICQL